MRCCMVLPDITPIASKIAAVPVRVLSIVAHITLVSPNVAPILGRISLVAILHVFAQIRPVSTLEEMPMTSGHGD